MFTLGFLYGFSFGSYTWQTLCNLSHVLSSGHGPVLLKATLPHCSSTLLRTEKLRLPMSLFLHSPPPPILLHHLGMKSSDKKKEKKIKVKEAGQREAFIHLRDVQEVRKCVYVCVGVAIGSKSLRSMEC